MEFGILKPTLFIFTLLPHLLVAQHWDTVERSNILPVDSIAIYYRYIEIDGVDFLEFKGETYINSSLTSLASVLRDVDAMHEWLYNVDSARAENITEKERYTYFIHEPIGYIFKQRDSYIYSVISQNPTNLVVEINGVHAPDRGPRNTKYIRIEGGKSQWKLIPIDAKRTKVIFQGYADPGGWISPSVLIWLAKNEVWKLPYESLRNLKSQVKNAKYKNAEYLFIRNFE
jgi:hypothetical protein